MNQPYIVFFQEGGWSSRQYCNVPDYWGFYNWRGILQCHDTKAEAVEACADAQLTAMGVPSE